MNKRERESIKPCVGCGFCCKKSRCVASFIAENSLNKKPLLKIKDKIPKAEPECPFLYWDKDKYRCFLAKNKVYSQFLAVGEGCCSSLNSERSKYVISQEKTGKKT